MATNINVTAPNFCNSPRLSDEFCNVYDSTGTDYFRIVDNNGSTQVGPWGLDTSIDTVLSLEYAGARDVGTTLGDQLPFFTLEHNTNSHCTIREWRLSTSNTALELYNTITKTTNSGVEHFNCYSMSVEYHETEFSSTTATGTGKIQLSSIDNIDSGDKLLLGPSDIIGYIGDYEWVTVTSVSGGWVNLDSGAPYSSYRDTNSVAFYKNIYLFSDVGTTGDVSKGALYTLNPHTGAVEDVIDNGIYSGVRASAWSPSYQAVSFVKSNNLLYSTTSGTYQINRSQVLTNIQPDEKTVIPIYDLAFDGLSIFTLQQIRTLVDDDGLKMTDSTWSPYTNYNYHTDTIQPYVKNIDISASPASIMVNNVLGTKDVTLTAVVRDQFGVGLQSEDITFSKSGDGAGYFTPLNGHVTTNINGVATILYTPGVYNLPFGGPDIEYVLFSANHPSGGFVGHGSSYVWENIELLLLKKFTIEFGEGNELGGIVQRSTLSGTWPTEESELYQATHMNQMEDYEIIIGLVSKSKFQFPGGDWEGSTSPIDGTKSIDQRPDFESEVNMSQLDSDFDNEVHFNQDLDHENDLQVSQVYVSRHILDEHKDDVTINQFRFIEDAIPAFWSYKNVVSTNIWIRLRPYAFDLNQSTLVFKVREVSYVGDTGYIDVTSKCVVSTFDAGGGLLGLDILYDPDYNFHHNAVVYVAIEVYDGAPLPNIIVTEYWFKIIPDFKAPYIANEDPAREEEDVIRNTDISFDLYDDGAGVDISTLELYVNNRVVTPSVSIISGGYHIDYTHHRDFYYGQTVEVTVKVKDVSDSENTLYDMWRFYVEGSTGPWIDLDSFIPPKCTKGVDREWTPVSFNVYAVNDTGLNKDSIIVYIGGKKRAVMITPIVYRES